MLERELKREKTMESAAREKRSKTGRNPTLARALPNNTLSELLKSAEEEFYASIDDESGEIRKAAINRSEEYDSAKKGGMAMS